MADSEVPHYFIYDIKLDDRIGYFVPRKYNKLFNTLKSNTGAASSLRVVYTGKINNDDGTIGLLFSVTAKDEREAEEKLKNFMDMVHDIHSDLCFYVE